MLSSKFFVLRNYTNIIWFPLFDRHICNKALKSVKLPVTSAETNESPVKNLKDKNHVTNLTKVNEKCSYFKKLFNRCRSKCSRRITYKDYNEAQSVVTGCAKKFSKSLDEQLQSIQASLEKDLQEAQNKEAAEFRVLCDITECKLRQLMKLDAWCGSQKRKDILSLNDHTRRAFDKLQCDLAPSIAQLRQTLRKLHQDVTICTKRATFLVSSCQTCQTPEELNKCLKENANSAIKTLGIAEEEMITKVNNVKKCQEEIMRNHSKAREELVRSYRKKAETMSKYLDGCIHDVKNTRKKR